MQVNWAQASRSPARDIPHGTIRASIFLLFCPPRSNVFYLLSLFLRGDRVISVADLCRGVGVFLVSGEHFCVWGTGEIWLGAVKEWQAVLVLAWTLHFLRIHNHWKYSCFSFSENHLLRLVLQWAVNMHCPSVPLPQRTVNRVFRDFFFTIFSKSHINAATFYSVNLLIPAADVGCLLN